MGAKTTAYETALLDLIFNATTFTGMAENATASPVATLYVSLHTASPGVSGNQSTSEAAYTGYTRVGVTRTSAGWTVTGGSVSPAANVAFPQATGGTETETYFGVGTASTGIGTLLYFGAISPAIVVSSGIQPILASSSTVSET